MAEETLVKKADTVAIIGTGVSKFLPFGKEPKVPVHKVQADKLVAAGKATYVKAKGAKK